MVSMMKRTFTYLLTFCRCHGDTVVNNLESLIGESSIFENDAWLVKLFYSKWVKICWLLCFWRVLEAWKEVRLSEEILVISKSEQILPLRSYRPIGPEIDDRVIRHWALTEARNRSRYLNICWRYFWSCQVIWMLMMINGSKPGLNVNIVLWTQGWWTLPRKLNFLKWIDSWWRQFEVPSTRIILLLLFLWIIHAGHKSFKVITVDVLCCSSQ